MSDKNKFMKKQSIHFSLIFSINLLVLLSILSVAIAEPVNIPDPRLRAAVEDILTKEDGDTITQAEMGADDFTSLVGNDMDISDLTGLEFATNLQILFLQNNSISDLTPLSNLTRLTNLYLSNNNISDISALSNISAIHTLLLDNNNITNIDDLPDLGSVIHLRLQNNQISNIEPLVDHTEFTNVNNPYSTDVNLDGNPLDDVSINTHIPTLKSNRKIKVKFPFKFLKKISGDNQTVPTNTEMQPFVVEAYDINNNKLSGEKVTFSLSSTGSGDFVNGSHTEGWVATLLTTTDTDGRASATLITGSTVGSYTIYAKVLGATSKVFRVTVIQEVDMDRPTVSIDALTDPQNGAYDVTVRFSEAVTGFVQSELSVSGTSGAAITAWDAKIGGTDYVATITPTRTGTAIFNVAANVAEDAAENLNTAAVQQTVQVDLTHPTVSIDVPSSPQNGAYDVTVRFSEAVTGFVQSELSVSGTSGATITAWDAKIGGTDYVATITPTRTGTAIFNVAANVAEDTAENLNTAAAQQTVQVDLTHPTVSIDVPSSPQNGAYDVTVVFSEAVTGFVQSELSVSGTSGATITAWDAKIGGTDYIATITPTRTGTAIFNVAANVAEDAAENLNTAAAQQTVQIDLTHPTVSIDVPSSPQNGAYDVTVVFSEAVTGFVQSELSVSGTSGATITAWDAKTGGTDYVATITPTRTGTAIFNVAANVAEDAAENLNTAAAQQTVQVDLTHPTVSIDVPSSPQNGAYDVTVRFSEAVTGFVQSELSVSGTSGATITAWDAKTGGTDYVATITPTRTRTAIFNVAANVAEDTAENLNTAAAQQTVQVDLTHPTVSIDVPSSPQNGAYDVTVVFSEAVTGFVQSELSVSGTSGATITAWDAKTGGTDYVATITPTRTGTAIFNVAANVAEDAAENLNTAAAQQTVQVDLTHPTVSIDVPSSPQNGAYDVTVVFSEAVTGFVQSELSVSGTSGATITAWDAKIGGTDYVATITPT